MTLFLAAAAPDNSVYEAWQEMNLRSLETAGNVDVRLSPPAIVSTPAARNEAPPAQAPALVQILTSDEALRAQREEQEQKYKNDHQLLILNALLVAVTAGLVVFTGFLWRSTRALVIGAEKTAERQLRAYLLLETVQVHGVGVGEDPHIGITARNFGQTPAYDVSCWFAAGYGKYPPTVSPPSLTEDILSAKNPVGPGGSTEMHMNLRMKLSERQVKGLSDGEVAVYVSGGIRYRDTFGKTQTTTFYLYTGGSHGLSGNIGAMDTGNTCT